MGEIVANTAKEGRKNLRRVVREKKASSAENTAIINLPEIVGGGYRDYWYCTKRYRVVKGSRASKKSKTTALNLIVRMMQYPLANVLVVRKVANTLRDSCYSDLKWATYRLGVDHLWSFSTSPMAAVYKPTGQQIFFRGLDDPQKLASISCPVGSICWCWIEEAYEIDTEEDFDRLDDTIRGELPEGYYKQITLTLNPWSSSSWIKARFFDAPDDDTYATTTTYRCNEWLDEADLRRFEAMAQSNPTRYRVAGLGEWGIDGAVVFEEWRDEPEHYLDQRWTHVIEPFEVPADWRIYRGFDFGYAKPFSVGWYAVDHDGRLYRILELYGCTKTPNEGVKWTPAQIFGEIKRIESEHRWLVGKHIYGIADPSIWDASRGESVAETGEKLGVYFDAGDNKRIAGWMQLHNRLAFDERGIPMLYIFRTCKGFIRTVPQLKYDDVKPEDIDTDLEDHIADECRYVCMARPITPKVEAAPKVKPWSPLEPDNTPDADNEWYRRY